MTRVLFNGRAGQRPVAAPAGPGAAPAALTARPHHPAITGHGEQRGRPSVRRPPAAEAPTHADDGESGTHEALRSELAERTADLQRVKAEYDNYRKRVHRDHLAVREIAVANVLSSLLPVLDALDAARAHGRATDSLQPIITVLEDRLAALGLQPVGERGDAFDPALHEALATVPGIGVTRAVCAEVHRPGYRVGHHLLRPAEVTVAEPRPDTPPPPRA